MEKMACDSINGKELGSSIVLIDIPRVMAPALWRECCIYRVPKKLRKVNKEAYTPKLVSIGPFHHGRKELRDMEMHKQRYFKEFLYRSEKRQEDLRRIVEDNEVKLRHCYSEDCRLSRTDFVNMILLDAIFIIELCLRFYIYDRKNNEQELSLRTRENENDYITSQPWLRIALRHDLLPEVNFEEVKHFTDLVRYMFCSIPDLKPNGTLRNLYSATKLDEAGLKIKPVENRRLLNITFRGNTCLKYCPCFNLSWLLACLPCLKIFPCLESMECILEVPPLQIFDETEALFRNLMALEQCHYPNETYICSYAMLLDYLIDTEQDVDLLVDKKVIVNNIGSNVAVVTLINKLGIGIITGKSCYATLGRELNQYRDNHWNRIMASMKSVYFRDFWRGTATMVGLIVLGLTFWSFLRPYIK